MARWMAWLGAIGTIVGLACGGDTAGPEAGITVSLTVQPAFAEPGDTVRVTVTAVPTAGVAVAVIRVAASGLISKSDSVRVSGSGSQSFSQAYCSADPAVFAAAGCRLDGRRRLPGGGAPHESLSRDRESRERTHRHRTAQHDQPAQPGSGQRAGHGKQQGHGDHFLLGFRLRWPGHRVRSRLRHTTGAVGRRRRRPGDRGCPARSGWGPLGSTPARCS